MKFSQTFVTYHGCGYCYVDGTNLLQGTTRCFFPIHNPFWKEPCDASIELQNQPEINYKRNQLPQEATVKNILNTFENTKKVIIMLFSKMATLDR